MYGDERHISVLRSEIESNDVEYQSEGGWSFHDSMLKNYQPKHESTMKTTTTTSSTTFKSELSSTSKVTTQQEPTTTGMLGSYDNSSSENNTSTTDDTYTLQADELFTTESDFETTTEYEPQTFQTVSERPKPQMFQDFVEKSQTTEQAQMYKLRGVNACPVKEEVVAPFWANNTRGEVLALLNLYPFEQYVHWERCTFENKQMFCRQGCRCEQQYRLHRLLAYDPSNDCRGIFSDWFKFPSCCVCRCYDLPSELRLTSRSPRSPTTKQNGWNHPDNNR